MTDIAPFFGSTPQRKLQLVCQWLRAELADVLVALGCLRAIVEQLKAVTVHRITDAVGDAEKMPS
jgi:hypothetical protein